MGRVKLSLVVTLMAILYIGATSVLAETQVVQTQINVSMNSTCASINVKGEGSERTYSTNVSSISDVINLAFTRNVTCSKDPLENLSDTCNKAIANQLEIFNFINRTDSVSSELARCKTETQSYIDEKTKTEEKFTICEKEREGLNTEITGLRTQRDAEKSTADSLRTQISTMIEKTTYDEDIRKEQDRVTNAYVVAGALGLVGGYLFSRARAGKKGKIGLSSGGSAASLHSASF